MYKKRILIHLFLFLFICICNAQDAIRFKQLGTSEGLSQSWVRTITQDSTGYIWIGTADGLNRYNGYEFKVYQSVPNQENSLGNVSINYLEIIDRNRMWVATDQGVYQYNQLTDDFTKFPLLGQEVFQSILTQKKHIWFGTNNGLYRFNKADSSIVIFKYTEGEKYSLSNNFIRILFLDSDSNLFAGTFYGLNIYLGDNKFFKYYPNQSETRFWGNDIWTLYEDSEKRIWVGSGMGGLDLLTDYRDNPEQGRFTRIANGSYLDILQLNEQLWLARGGGEGLEILDLAHFNNTGEYKSDRYFAAPFSNQSLSDNSVISLFNDRNGDIWIGTFSGGVSYYSPRVKRFKVLEQLPAPEKSISSNLITAILETDEYLWLGTELGLNRINRITGNIKKYSQNERGAGNLSSDAVYSIFQDSEGTLWVGCWNGGLNRYNSDTESFIAYLPSRHKNSISNRNVFCVYEDRNKNLWIGTMGGGLNRLDRNTGEFKVYMKNPSDSLSIPHNEINDILQHSNGKLYISLLHQMASYNYENETFTRYVNNPSDSTSLNGGYILCLFEDTKQNLWLGTNKGLEFFDVENAKVTHYTTLDGMPSNSILCIEEDENGNLWLSTNKGISKFIKGTDVPEHPEFINYHKPDGLPGDEFMKRSGFKNSEGYIYFGSSKGLVKFHPDSIQANKKIPPVVISQFKLINTSSKNAENLITQETRLLELNYEQSDFIIEFAALNYLASEDNQYQYKLDGYDEDWHQPVKNRSATYTNIQPGKYQFMVKGSNNDGVWNPEPAILQIHINPPWWSTLAFKISFITLISLMLFTFYRIRINMLNEQKVILEQNVKKRTKELSELNDVLKGKQEEISAQNDELSTHRNHLEKLVEERTVELIEAKEKAEQSDRLKSAFLANMSHEIRTPMNAIVGFSSLLNKTPLKDSSRERYVNIIKSNSKALLTIINDILDISMIEANQIVLNETTFSINRLINELHNYYVLETRENNELCIEAHVAESDVFITTDEVRLRQVLTNLINNALKYTESGYIKFGYTTNEESINFFVKDSGVGIPKEEQKYIFNYFHKVENRGEKFYAGTGVGLSITKHLIEMMKGSIWLESELNKGSSFFFTLPNQHIKPPEMEIPLQVSGTPDLKGKHVVIVEDNENNYELIENMIKPTGAKLSWMRNGFEAIHHFEKNTNAEGCIVLLDIKMPIMDGYTCIKRLQEMNVTVPVIAVTAFAQPSDKKEAAAAGFRAHLSKPVNSQELMAVLAHYLLKN